ncbi:redox-regulated ATPase YchF [Deltaproteobacteria bacterium Smac51]|nr:redox-regulated ATPase YchF [Deltaproteobacteria bacterium Smac51]
MKAGIIGWPGSGRDAIFSSLTGLSRPPFGSADARQGEALVPDDRLDKLTAMFQPKKHTPARLEFFLPHPVGLPKEALKASLEKVRETEVILLVLRNFAQEGEAAPNPAKEIADLESELIVSDYLVVEKRLERMAEEVKRGKKNDPEELELLEKAKAELESNRPLRLDPIYSRSPKLRGFAFLSAKPLLAVINNADDDDKTVELNGPWPKVVVRGRLEEELAQMEPEDAAEFLSDYQLTEPAAARVIREVYHLMGLISFFTVGEDECRAWTIQAGETALDAAGAIHSDIQKGFIRAEVVSYEDFSAAGGMNEAKKKGSFRLEGKTYVVTDGDIVHFRFNV